MGRCWVRKGKCPTQHKSNHSEGGKPRMKPPDRFEVLREAWQAKVVHQSPGRACISVLLHLVMGRQQISKTKALAQI